LIILHIFVPTNKNKAIMKATTKTIKGWAINTCFMFSENVTNTLFKANLEKYASENLQGYKRLSATDTLKGKKVTEKVIIKGWYWQGSWSEPIKRTAAIYYK